MTEKFDIELEADRKNEKEFDAQNSRCIGLLERKALRSKDNKFVYADNISKKDGPFYCPVCLSNVVVRKCIEKVDHFAHIARQSPVIKSIHESLHNLCIDQLLESLKSSFPDGKWEKEREIPKNIEKGFKKIIPDISGRIGKVPVAIEVQASAYTIRRLFAKLEEYKKRSIAVLYIVPLFDELGNEPFRPRLYEKYLHSIYFGRVYYWTKELGNMLLPIHYSPTKRWIEESTWYDTEAREERTEGGFWLTYRTMKMPNYGQRVDITKDFIKTIRKEFEPKNVKKIIPESIIFKDNLKEWWDRNEHKDINKQFTMFVGNNKSNFLEQYNYLDDYDDEHYEC